jgi:hypothetical protein
MTTKVFLIKLVSLITINRPAVNNLGGKIIESWGRKLGANCFKGGGINEMSGVR